MENLIKCARDEYIGEERRIFPFPRLKHKPLGNGPQNLKTSQIILVVMNLFLLLLIITFIFLLLSAKWFTLDNYPFK